MASAPLISETAVGARHETDNAEFRRRVDATTEEDIRRQMRADPAGCLSVAA